VTPPNTDLALVSTTPKPPARADKPRLPSLRADQMPTPIEKAAMVLTAIGPELASGFLRELAEPDMERFARAINGLGKINQEVLDAVIVEFLELLTTGPEISGGSKAARKLLAAVLDDEEEVDRLIEGRRKSEVRSVWERLNDTPVPTLATFLQAEHPQTAAVILSEMRPEIAASVLERLDRPFAQTIVLRLSRVPQLDPPIAASIQGAIERDFLSVLQRNLSKRRPADLIAGLMNNISTEVREGFLSYLETQEPALAQDVQRTMFTFEDISVRLHGRDVAGVLRDVPEEDLLKALKLGEAQGSATVGFILENLPRRLSERYLEELAALTDVTRKEGEAAQIEVTKAIQAQAKAGTIRFIEKDAAFG
jgi:flagellar motor switch protein FliG